MNAARKASGIIWYRIRSQGARVTLQWAFARSISRITGIPWLASSRITPEIYVGPQYRLPGKRTLEQMGIHFSINLRLEFDDAVNGLALQNYCYLPTVDDEAPSLEHLSEGVDFVNKAIKEGGKVYIHCKGGVGRSPTMAAAYFISQGLGHGQAIQLIKESRPFIKLMPMQIMQLKLFEKIMVQKY